MKIRNTFLAMSSLALVACGSDGETKQAEPEKKIEFAQETCSYSYDANAVTAAWTAFKFTEKAGVGGQFDSVVVSTAGSVDTPEKILGGLSFEIPISSVNTKNPDRDKKIMESFFGTMANTGSITGSIVGMKGNGEAGTAQVKLTMNDSTYQQELKYAIEGTKVSLTGTIDVVNWDGMSAIDALNKVCEELHKGEDGVSKLWPTVDINISAVLSKDCK